MLPFCLLTLMGNDPYDEEAVSGASSAEAEKLDLMGEFHEVQGKGDQPQPWTPTADHTGALEVITQLRLD
ncbi:unnamed protein product [Echinostoma caproni]|uniref:Secreted protein n=1 Tax=Echinostoma caproni TaxID=27848 RepID=A0A183A695_9TREM|nr:unnamed protein product [Echinostoma caproni]